MDVLSSILGGFGGILGTIAQWSGTNQFFVLFFILLLVYIGFDVIYHKGISSGERLMGYAKTILLFLIVLAAVYFFMWSKV